MYRSVVLSLECPSSCFMINVGILPSFPPSVENVCLSECQEIMRDAQALGNRVDVALNQVAVA
jgi:hypothetical protein